MNTLVIEKSALKQNISLVKEQAGSSYIYANLSGDGYGAGAAQLALLLRDEGIRRFCVDSAADAEALRKAGLVDEEILMLHSTSDAEVLSRLADLGAVCSVGTLEAGMALNALAESRATVIEAHLQLDCGLGFGGFPAEEPEKIVSVIKNLPRLAFSGVYTQLGGERAMEEQLAAFQRAVDALRAAGCETGVVHAAGSSAMLRSESAHLDAVRAGSILLGRCARTRGDGLATVGHGETTVASVQWLPKGHTVGLDRRVKLRRATRVAVLPVGYQNGFGAARPVYGILEAIRRALRARRSTVRINGQRVRVLGGAGARETLVDVTNVKCAEGDVAVFPLDPMFAKNCRREYR